MDRAFHVIDIGPGTGIEASESNKSMFNLVWKSITCTSSYHSSGIKWYKAVQQRNWCLSPFRLVETFWVSLWHKSMSLESHPYTHTPMCYPTDHSFFCCAVPSCVRLFVTPWIVAQASRVSLVVRNVPVSAGNARDTGSIPGSGRSPGVGHGNPLQYSCPG